MPPPKAKLHKNTGRLKNITSSHGNSPSTGNRENPTSVNNQNNPNTQVERNRTNIRNDGQANTNNSGDTPAIEQFELELYWCIQTLENSLASGKLNAKQVQDTEKTIKSLKSNNQPMVKKRQLMQSAFGDYRKKMADEEKKLRVGNTSIQFEAPKEQSASTNKGHFVKKSFTSTLENNSNFQFNFPIDAMEKLSIENSNEKNDEKSLKNVKSEDKAVAEISIQNVNDKTNAVTFTEHSNPFIKSKFTTSDSSFKFNFAVNSD